MATNDISRKRHSVSNQQMYFWFNSTNGPVYCAALYKIDMCFLNIRTNDDNPKVVDKIVNQSNSLERVDVFFKMCFRKRTSYASLTPIGSSSKYLLIPNEFDRSFNIMCGRGNKLFTREKPIVYTLVNDGINTCVKLDNPPVGRKVYPITVTVKNKVYVLSRRHVGQYVLPEPSFEAYNPKTNSWKPLSPPRFNLNDTSPSPMHSPDSTRNWKSPGYAVFNELIIVNFCNRQEDKFHIYSYNTRFDEWKPICCPIVPRVVYDDGTLFDDGNDNNNNNKNKVVDYLAWDGEAIVVKNYIHAFVQCFHNLLSYKFVESNEKGCTLSLDDSIVMKQRTLPEQWKPLWNSWSEITGAVGKIGDDLICLVQTIRGGRGISYEKQPVHLTTYRLDENGRICSRLQSIDLSMPVDEIFRGSSISSFFILPRKVAASERDNEEEEPTPRKHELPFKGADAAAALVSDVAMMKIA